MIRNIDELSRRSIREEAKEGLRLTQLGERGWGLWNTPRSNKSR